MTTAAECGTLHTENLPKQPFPFIHPTEFCVLESNSVCVFQTQWLIFLHFAAAYFVVFNIIYYLVLTYPFQ